MTCSDHLQLETQRLIIRPLTHAQLFDYLQLDQLLETQLGLQPYPRTMSSDLIEAFEQVILPQVANQENNPLYSTLWTIIDREKEVMIGDMCFKGAPNQQGEIEVGYGTYADFQGKGYMTEALAALLDWAFSQPSVLSVIAETDKDNVASHRILQKNNFLSFLESNTILWWRLEKNNMTTKPTFE